MVRRNAAATQAAFLLIVQIWESLIKGKYFKEASKYHAPPCPTCNSPKDCNNYFCVQCKTGGLCPMVFRRDQEHCNHPWLQVRHYTRQYSVLSPELEHFISKEGLKHIHTNGRNDGKRHCNLRSKQVAGASSSRAKVEGEKSCQGCRASIYGSKGSRETFLVCSLQCLMKVARGRSKWDLLAMNDGAMKLMGPPLFYTEKLLNPPRMLEIPTATPVDEAPPSPQATADCPMSTETHEPPATEDFPMFEKPAAPAETFEPETFSLPLLPTKFQDFDKNPEWQEWAAEVERQTKIKSSPLEEPELFGMSV